MSAVTERRRRIFNFKNFNFDASVYGMVLPDSVETKRTETTRPYDS
ncbi:hypothetical protein RMSM_04219 [Rhodopirellula maiorica SM1]|uniref:Uncharacterized protein n=1 Tax=Rhodopirellula maiorica SM1 TaxID=1265738 RepID=M5RY55_9BACT|nr:hypothetical protein RMSM_04219 [Rhodopirellula maiorica SM1]